MKKKRLTIKDIANLAGVSSATVSRHLTKKGYLSPESKKKIENIIEETNYQPSKVAISLKLGKTYTVGFIRTCFGSLKYK